MTELDQARAALKKLGVEGVDQLSDAEVGAYVSSLVGSLTSFATALRTTFRLSVEGLARLAAAFAKAVEPQAADPVAAVLARLAEIEG